jgi:hypothetical protein
MEVGAVPTVGVISDIALIALAIGDVAWESRALPLAWRALDARPQNALPTIPR